MNETEALAEIYAPMQFESLKLIEIPVTIADKNYILKEAPEDAAADFRNAQIMTMRVNEYSEGNKVSTFGKIIDTEAMLVSSCLFEVIEKDGTRIEKQVPLGVIKKWPHRITNALFKRAEKISKLEKKESKDELNKKKKEIEQKLKQLEAQPKDEEKADSIEELEVKN